MPSIWLNLLFLNCCLKNSMLFSSNPVLHGTSCTKKTWEDYYIPYTPLLLIAYNIASSYGLLQGLHSSDHIFCNVKDIVSSSWSNPLQLLNAMKVLWPECGWQPVSLTDLITSTSVKKVYHKATLCVHPDKVQQKGATVRQKYIAEKVFDLLKVRIYANQVMKFRFFILISDMYMFVIWFVY